MELHFSVTTILHVFDPTAGLDSLDTLALLVNGVPGRHQILVLGHYGWSDAARLAGIPPSATLWSRALGRWDPMMWRTVGRAVREIHPTHIHAWGLWGMAAVTRTTDFEGPRLANFQIPPNRRAMAALRRTVAQRPWLFVTPWNATVTALGAGGIPPPHIVRVAPGRWTIPNQPPAPANLRRILHLPPRDGPVIMLGGWSEDALRHDHAIWATAIISHVHQEAWGLMRMDEVPRKEWVNPYAGYQSFTRTLKDPGLIAMAPSQFSWRQLAALADVFVFTPQRASGMNALLAAMDMAKPIVCTAISQARELLTDGRDALLAPPENPREIAGRINAILQDKSLGERLGREAGATYSRRCAPEILVAQMSSIYSQIRQDPTLRGTVVLPADATTGRWDGAPRSGENSRNA